MATADVQVREVSPGLWSCYWTDGKGTLQGTVSDDRRPTVTVAQEDGLFVMRDQLGTVLAKQGKDRSDAELGLTDEDHHWGDL